jgi:predicted ATPase
LKIRIWDDRHFLSLPFNEHSTGFQWFFSFLAALSEYENRATPVIILLDEPALGLHARAQADFLRSNTSPSISSSIIMNACPRDVLAFQKRSRQESMKFGQP